ncbi:hypothetical protein T10_526 [Trichinella papuae]|uniref:Uncharacterized protein n=1 Tax=Trichinella papuae TaxID=268474 RepID=A0A0V1MZ24_9BILA|nr:hypothetical protein T10_526 [Trichinella papuae]
MVKTAKIGETLLTINFRSVSPSETERYYKSSVKHKRGRRVSCPSTLTHRRFTEIV